MKLNKKMKVLALGIASLSGTLLSAAETRLLITVPFDFVAGGKRLPAGNYNIQSETETNLILLHGDAPDSAVALITTPGGRSMAGSDRGLKFEKHDGETFLSEINLDEFAVRLVKSKMPKE
jgi:hypothetical protein